MVVLVVGGAAIVSIVTLSGSPTHGHGAPVHPPTGAPPELAAQTACTNMRTVQRLIASNASSDSVFSYISAARTQIAAAVLGDPSWRSLQSGIESINNGLQDDDSSAAAVGIAIVRYQCRRAGVQLAP